MPSYNIGLCFGLLPSLNPNMIRMAFFDESFSCSNVLISSWLPQTSLLAHSGVKLFVTHGGAGSVQETICHKTPIVGIPLAGDQIVNVKESVYKHIGVQVSAMQEHEVNIQE